MNRIEGQTLLTLRVNGETMQTAAYPFETLLDVLRDRLGFTGCKPGCENGDCGACTVLWDGLPMKSCLCLAAEAQGHEIVTAEGLATSPIHQAFISHFAMQCGYCTPGFVVNAHALLLSHPDPDDYTMETWLQSNICRCTCYEEIIAAVREAAADNKEESL